MSNAPYIAAKANPNDVLNSMWGQAGESELRTLRGFSIAFALLSDFWQVEGPQRAGPWRVAHLRSAIIPPWPGGFFSEIRSDFLERVDAPFGSLGFAVKCSFLVIWVVTRFGTSREW